MTAEEQKEFDEKNAKVTELTGKVDELVTELDKQKEIVTNAEKKVNEFGNETGENRKELTAALRDSVTSNKALRESEDNLRKLTEELAEAKKVAGPTPDGNNQPDDKKKSNDEIEAGLTTDEAKRLDDAYENASEETKANIKSDAKTRRKFLLIAKESVEEDQKADLSSWRNKPQPEEKSPSGDEDKLRELFKTAKKRANYVPRGPSGGTPRAGQTERKAPAHRGAAWMAG